MEKDGRPALSVRGEEGLEAAAVLRNTGQVLHNVSLSWGLSDGFPVRRLGS